VPPLIYAGVGSRRTPPHVFDFMVETARILAARGWWARSGGAAGADTAIQNGALLWTPARFELYLPWAGYRHHQVARLDSPTEEAFEHAAKYHPAWERLEPEARALHARNSHIVCGPNLRAPVKFVLCWTPDGSLDGRGPDCGGTGQALRVAAAYGIPVFNLARDEDMDRVGALLGDAYTSPRLFS
jgi:hypothetical protein